MSSHWSENQTKTKKGLMRYIFISLMYTVFPVEQEVWCVSVCEETAKQCVYQWWEITPQPRHLRGIWFCIALQEKAHAFLVWPVRIEARHHHYLPWKVPYEAGRAEHRFTQTAKAFYHKAESSLWSPTGVWGKGKYGVGNGGQVRCLTQYRSPPHFRWCGATDRWI